MERLRFAKLEKLFHTRNALCSVAISLACDLFENGVTSAEWHEIGMRKELGEYDRYKKVDPMFRAVPDSMRLDIYNHLRSLEAGREKPTLYRLRKADSKYPF